MVSLMNRLFGSRIPESEAMDTIDEAETFDRLAEKYLYIAEDLIAQMALAVAPPTGRFLELCSGTARIPIKIAQLNPSCEVMAVDYSGNMIRLARENAERAAVGRRVRLIQGDAKKLPFKENFFDLVTSSHAIHHLADPVQFFNEVARVVKPSGAILLIDLRRPPRALIPAVVSVFGFGSEPLMRTLYRDSLQAAYTIHELSKLLKQSRLNDATIRTYFPGYVAIVKPSQDKQDVTKELNINPLTTLKSVLRAKWSGKSAIATTMR
jgi:ubiquinone/menaquinone biosynthesis C-methylase UbiE